ncbi:MAG: efflux RND transporter periplasmic adaptor subunit [Planctomycetota bacterium]
MAERKTKRSRRATGVWVTVAGVAAIASGVVAFGWSGQGGDERDLDAPGVAPPSVPVEPIAWSPSYDVERAFVGRVEGRQEARVGFEVGGMIEAVRVDEGDRVEARALLARLNTDRLGARRQELIASVAAARAERELASIRRERVAELRDRNATTAREWDEVVARFDAAEAALASAEAAVASIDVELAKSEIVAPFDAIVSMRWAEPGQVVSAGADVMELLESDRPRVRVAVGGPAIGELVVGDRWSVEIDGRAYEGELTAILPRRGEVVRGVDALITLDASLGELRAGDLARLSVSRTLNESGHWLPVDALTRGERGLWAAYTVASDASGVDRLRRVDIELLHVDGDRAYVRSGLREGSTVVTGGLHRVAVGMAVRPTVVAPVALDADAEAGAQP